MEPQPEAKMKDSAYHIPEQALLTTGVQWTLSAQTQQASSQRKPNIIFIMSDDHGYQAISAYSNKLIRTPNIDRIGREGAIMRNAFVTNSICSPARAVILTGKYSHRNGMRDNGTYFDGQSADASEDTEGKWLSHGPGRGVAPVQ